MAETIENLLDKLVICDNKDNDADECVLIQNEINHLQSRITELQAKLKSKEKTSTPPSHPHHESITSCSILHLLKDICDEFESIQEHTSIWKGSIFENIDKLKLDYSGKVGEVFIDNLCKKLRIDSAFSNDVNSKDGTYDNIIFNKKVEIKTARLGNKGTFQHESLRNGGCDFYLFMDVTPTCVYITILPYFDLNERCKITGRKAHLRKGTIDVFKFDLTEKNIRLAIEKGYAVQVSIDSSLQEVSQLFKSVVGTPLCEL